LRSRLESAEGEAQTLREKNTQQTASNEKLTNEIESLRKQITELESEKQLRSRPTGKPEAPQPQAPALELPIPQDAPSDIMTALREIASKSGVAYQTKVQLALSAVIDGFAKKAGEAAVQIETAERKRESALGLLEMLAKAVAQAVDAEESIAVQYAESPARRTTLLTKLTVFKETFQKLSYEKAQFEELRSAIAERLKVKDHASVLPAVDKLIIDFGNMAAVLEEAKMQIRKVKKENNALRSEADAKLHELCNRMAVLQADFESLQTKHREYEEQILQSQTREHDQTSQIEQLQRELAEAKAAHEASARDELVRHEDHIQFLKGQYQGTLSEYQARIQQMTQELAQEKSQRSVLKKAISALKKKLTATERTTETSRKDTEGAAARLRQRLDEELKAARAVSDEKIAQLTSKSTELTATNEKLTEYVQSLEQKNAQLSKESRALRRKKSQLESQLASQTESSARERQLAQAQLKSAELNAETKAQSAIAASKTEGQREAKKMISIFAEEFRSVIDPLETFEIASFPEMVRRARQELTRLNDEIMGVRRVVNPLPGQTLHDAVAQAVYGAS
jgi:DNA repair exonuclease SbcCD ATPase subunit